MTANALHASHAVGGSLPIGVGVDVTVAAHRRVDIQQHHAVLGMTLDVRAMASLAGYARLFGIRDRGVEIATVTVKAGTVILICFGVLTALGRLVAPD